MSPFFPPPLPLVFSYFLNQPTSYLNKSVLLGKTSIPWSIKALIQGEILLTLTFQDPLLTGLNPSMVFFIFFTNRFLLTTKYLLYPHFLISGNSPRGSIFFFFKALFKNRTLSGDYKCWEALFPSKLVLGARKIVFGEPLVSVTDWSVILQRPSF